MTDKLIAALDSLDDAAHARNHSSTRAERRNFLDAIDALRVGIAELVAERDTWVARAVSMFPFVPGDLLAGDLQAARDEIAAKLARLDEAEARLATLAQIAYDFLLGAGFDMDSAPLNTIKAAALAQPKPEEDEP